MSIPIVSEPEEGYIPLNGLPRAIRSLKKEMHRAARRLDFEEAARLRDRIVHLEDKELAYRGSSNF